MKRFIDHNELARRSQVVERIQRGERVAVVADAGMPGISDPGERLVAAAAAAGHRIEIVPGPSAAVATALLIESMLGGFEIPVTLAVTGELLDSPLDERPARDH